ncbi:DUF6350 family protein [Corynebacterium kutscheri]|uniref:Uncharacterized protein n=1 Tax=Corynebacterium kutscheri TaxID=35755 RepID=A0A0F6R1H6_9CORY|nr:DUF6350 family protein [Corynebacterium kutscheri]AKE41855.1 hypothetical protein UL82_08490 [Corynebacterium kutscheri]VEH10183.1 hypothetical membrane protein [Corynebacterium kutscheri]
MSKNTSPKPGPSRSTRGRAAGAPSPTRNTRGTSSARRIGAKKRIDAPPTAPPSARARFQRLLPVALIPNGIMLVVAIIFALVALVSTSTSMDALPATIANAWLIINVVPVTGRGVSFATLPLLPAMLLVWLVAKRVYAAVKDRVSLADLGMVIAVVLGIPLLLTLTSWAMLLDAAEVFDLQAPHLGTAFLRTAGVHITGLVIGMGRRLWDALARRYLVPTVLIDAARTAATIMVSLAACSLSVYLISLFGHYRQVNEVLSLYNPLGAVGAILLSIAYVPNMVIYTAAVLMGSEFIFGNGIFSLFSVNAVALPPLPALAAVPITAPPWAALLMALVPISVIVVIWRKPPRIVEAVAITGYVVAMYLFVVLMSSGTVGIYGYVGPHIWLSLGLLALWVFAVTGIAAGVVAFIQRGVTEQLSEDSAELNHDMVEEAEQPEAEDADQQPHLDSEESETTDIAEVDAQPVAEAEEPDISTATEDHDQEDMAVNEPEIEVSDTETNVDPETINDVEETELITQQTNGVNTEIDTAADSETPTDTAETNPEGTPSSPEIVTDSSNDPYESEDTHTSR